MHTACPPATGTAGAAVSARCACKSAKPFLFVEQPRGNSAAATLLRAAATHKPKELGAISVGPPAYDRLEDPFARARLVLPALLVYDCREVSASATPELDAVEYLERRDRRLLRLHVQHVCASSLEILASANWLLPRGLPPGARQLLRLGKRDLRRER